MQKWRYFVRSAYTDKTSVEVMTHLNQLGANGWELVTLYRDMIEDSESGINREGVVMILKRPEPPPAEK